MVSKYYVGTSGWHYEHWRGRFYPMELPKSKWLEFYARSFGTVELNNSFYHLPSEKAFANWRDSSPEGFVYAVKVSRFITHIKKLRDVEEALAQKLRGKGENKNCTWQVRKPALQTLWRGAEKQSMFTSTTTLRLSRCRTRSHWRRS